MKKRSEAKLRVSGCGLPGPIVITGNHPLNIRDKRQALSPERFDVPAVAKSGRSEELHCAAVIGAW